MPRNLKNLLKKIIRKVAAFLQHRPTMKRTAVTFLRPFPGVKQHLSQIAFTGATPGKYYQSGSTELHNLSPRARQIYFDLKRAIKNRK